MVTEYKSPSPFLPVVVTKIEGCDIQITSTREKEYSQFPYRQGPTTAVKELVGSWREYSGLDRAPPFRHGRRV